MNNVCIVGRICRDLELRTISTGSTTTSFAVAVNRRFANQNGEREADFIPCVAWGKTAEFICKYFTKGSAIAVTGRIQTRNYDDKDGKKVYVTEIVAENVSFVEGKNKGNSEYSNETNNEGVEMGSVPTSDVSEDPFKDFGSEVVLSDDDLPF